MRQKKKSPENSMIGVCTHLFQHQEFTEQLNVKFSKEKTGNKQYNKLLAQIDISPLYLFTFSLPLLISRTDEIVFYYYDFRKNASKSLITTLIDSPSQLKAFKKMKCCIPDSQIASVLIYSISEIIK